MRFYFCVICNCIHSSHRHPTAEILLGTELDSNGEIIMASQDLTVDLSTESGPVYATIGTLYADGQPITDTVASATFAVEDTGIASINSQDGVSEAQIVLAGVDGSTNVSLQFTTSTGATGTGVALLTVTGVAGGGTGVTTTADVILSLTPPAAAATAPAA